jgi:hypothetical protein
MFINFIEYTISIMAKLHYTNQLANLMCNITN